LTVLQAQLLYDRPVDDKEQVDTTGGANLFKIESGITIASTAAINTGMCSGLHPAITPLTAIFQGVALRRAAGRTHISS